MDSIIGVIKTAHATQWMGKMMLFSFIHFSSAAAAAASPSSSSSSSHSSSFYSYSCRHARFLLHALVEVGGPKRMLETHTYYTTHSHLHSRVQKCVIPFLKWLIWSINSIWIWIMTTPECVLWLWSIDVCVWRILRRVRDFSIENFHQPMEWLYYKIHIYCNYFGECELCGSHILTHTHSEDSYDEFCCCFFFRTFPMSHWDVLFVPFFAITACKHPMKIYI